MLAESVQYNMRSALILLVGLAAVALAQDTYKCPDNWLLNVGKQRTPV